MKKWGMALRQCGQIPGKADPQLQFEFFQKQRQPRLRELLPALEWVKIELSAEEEDAGSIVKEGTKASSIGFDGLNL